MAKATLYDFLEVIIKDNPTYPFPIHLVREELVALLLSQEEFLYFVKQIHSKLSNFDGTMTANIFTTLLDRSILQDNTSPEDLPYQEYALKISDLIARLEDIQITRIDRSSPDYDMLKEMAKN
jgi:hypothetical protein